MRNNSTREGRIWFSYLMLIESRYQPDKVFVARLIYSRPCGRQALYTRASRDTDYDTACAIIDFLEELRR